MSPSLRVAVLRATLPAENTMDDDDDDLDLLLDLNVSGFKDFANPLSLDPDDTRWRRRMWRASISEAALLTAEEVAEALPGRAQVNRRWLERVPRVRLPNGQEVFRWADVLRHLERVA